LSRRGVASSCRSFPQQPLAAAEQDGEDHQAQLVYEIVLEQGLCELRAAVDDDVSGVLVAQPLCRLHRVAFEYGRVVPPSGVGVCADHVLGHAVELVGERVFSAGPCVGEPVVGEAAQE
jgi:hypothetical protein